jgi:rhamnosyltransferase subunit B
LDRFVNYDAVVTAPGSLGDFNPMLGIARRLQSLGRRVLMIGAEPYLPLAVRAGLDVRALVSTEDFQSSVSNPDLWHPRHGLRLIFDKMVGEGIEGHYRWLEENFDPSKTILVSHMLDFAGRVYRDRHPECRQATVLLSPSVLRSIQDPPRLTSFGLEKRLPPMLVDLLYRVGDAWIDRLAGKHVNRLRASVGLGKIKRVANRWWHSPDLSIAMFPNWFIGDERLLEGGNLTVGFPLTDSGDVLPPEVEAEVNRIFALFGSARPVLFAPGSAHYQAGPFLKIASDACQQLQLPAILISTNPDEIPKNLPSNVVAASYLPFSKVLHHCHAVVHHGGIGTTSQCLQAGVPQLVLPMAFDQFDNADRVQRLGCGLWFPKRRMSVTRMVDYLQRLPQSSKQSSQIAKHFLPNDDACLRAAEAIMHLYERNRQ